MQLLARVSLAILLTILVGNPASAQPIGGMPPPVDRPPDDPHADRPLLRPAHKPRDVVIEIPGERSTTNRVLLGASLGIGVIAGAIGAYYHLDSRDAASQVEQFKFNGEAWTQEEVDLVERGDRDRTRAAIGYSIGGVFLVGTIVAFIVTAPKSETTVIRTGAQSPTAPSSRLQPVLVPGGALATFGGTF